VSGTNGALFHDGRDGCGRRDPLGVGSGPECLLTKDNASVKVTSRHSRTYLTLVIREVMPKKPSQKILVLLSLLERLYARFLVLFIVNKE